MRKRWRWLVGALALLLLLLVIGSWAVDEPLRRRVETGVNQALKGYHVKIRSLDFHPLGLAVDLVDGVIIQDAAPDPPVAWVPRLHASVQWLALLRGKLVADFRFDRPEFYLDVRHAKNEARDKTPIENRGWQEAARAIFPLKLNLLRIDDGQVTYLEQGPLGPVYVSNLNFRAGNIRNVASKEGVYPSDVQFTATVQQSAKVRLDGHADFLAEPNAAIKAKFDVEGLKLASLEPIAKEWDVALRRGTLAANGQIEYAPKVKTVDVVKATVDGADVEYVKRRPGQDTVGEKAAKTAADVTQQPTIAVKAKEIHVDSSTLAYDNQTTDPPYRLFVNDCDITVKDFTNVRRKDPDAKDTGTAEVKGRFMDSGKTYAYAAFWPREHRTDFYTWLSIEDADTRTMNDLWRAYGKFDVENGSFTLYSEMNVAKDRVDGYVIPIFRHLEIADARGKGIGQKIYEGIVAGAAQILQNRPHDQVATATSLSGPLENPRTSALQVFGGLVQNAFIRAILPGVPDNDSKKK